MQHSTLVLLRKAERDANHGKWSIETDSSGECRIRRGDEDVVEIDGYGVEFAPQAAVEEKLKELVKHGFVTVRISVEDAEDIACFKWTTPSVSRVASECKKALAEVSP